MPARVAFFVVFFFFFFCFFLGGGENIINIKDKVMTNTVKERISS